MPERHLVNGDVGDWIEVRSPGGGQPRRGQILEVLGLAGHKHYRLKWTDDHESIFFPADGASIVSAEAQHQEATPT